MNALVSWESAGELVTDQACSEIADQYQDIIERMKTAMRSIKACGQELKDLFKDNSSYTFDVDFEYRGNNTSEDRIMGQIERSAWGIIVNKLGIRNLMSVKSRKEFDEQLEKGKLPDLTADNILATIRGLSADAPNMAKEACKEVFRLLTPSGWFRKYKTNSNFRVGRRVILSWWVEQFNSKWHRNDSLCRVPYNYQPEIMAIDNVFHLLDGKGAVKTYRGPLQNAIEETTYGDGKGETEYFRFKCFKNGNLHLEFKRLDLVRQLNLQAAGEAILGNDTD